MHNSKIINYYLKGIEFVAFDYPFETKHLEDYYIRGIRLQHFKTEIIVTFSKKESIAAIGIFLLKVECLSEKASIFIEIEAGFEVEINEADLNAENLLNICEYSNSSLIKLKAKSSDYDMLKEKGIICYYELDDTYAGDVLEEILNNFPNPLKK